MYMSIYMCVCTCAFLCHCEHWNFQPLRILIRMHMSREDTWMNTFIVPFSLLLTILELKAKATDTWIKPKETKPKNCHIFPSSTISFSPVYIHCWLPTELELELDIFGNIFFCSSKEQLYSRIKKNHNKINLLMARWYDSLGIKQHSDLNIWREESGRRKEAKAS